MTEKQKYCIICGEPCRKNDKNFCSDYCQNISIERDREMLKHSIQWAKLSPMESEFLL